MHNSYIIWGWEYVWRKMKGIKMDNTIHQQFWCWCRLSGVTMKDKVEQLVMDCMIKNPIKDKHLEFKVASQPKETNK